MEQASPSDSDPNESPTNPTSLRVCVAIISCVILITVGHWAVLRFKIPIYTPLDWWFWQFRDTAVPKWWLFYPLIMGLVLGGALIIHRWPERRALNLTLILALGVATQFCFAMVSGHGIDSVRTRLICSGHGEFALVALAEDDALNVLTDYEDLLDDGRLGNFCMTKPPGQLGFYMLTERTSHLFSGLMSSDDPPVRFGLFATFTWTGLAALAAVALFFLSRRYLSGSLAFVPSLLFITMPNFCLIPMHLDQVLYPLLFLSAILLWTRALREQSITAAVAAGVVAFVSVYISFSLLVILPALALFTAIHLIVNRPLTQQARRVAVMGLLFAMGYGLLHLLADAFLDFEIVERYRGAMEFHATWKHTIVRMRDVIHLFLMGYLDYAVWASFALVVLFCAAAIICGKSLARLKPTEGDWITLATIGLFLFVGMFGKAKGETARLWIFLSPLLCLSAAFTLKNWPPRSRAIALMIILALQMTTTLLIRRYQDFF